VGLAPKPESPPSSLACPRDATPGRGSPPAPQFQSLATSHGIEGAGDKPTRRDACSPCEGTGAGLPRSLPTPEEPLPCPSACSPGAEKRPRASPQPLGGGSRKSRTLVSPHLRKELVGRVGSAGARGKGEEARAGQGCRGARATTPAWAESTFAPKLADVQENPASRGRRLPRAPPAGELDSGEQRSLLRF